MSTPSNPYIANAQTALDILTSKWFGADAPGNWVPDDYWRTPTICRTLIAAMEQFATPDYVDTIVNAYNAGNPYTTSCGYYDDLSVWGGMYTKGCMFLKSIGHDSDADDFLSEAKAVCAQLKTAADSVCGGGDWWKRDPKSYPGNFKAANATIGWAEAAADLYAITNDKQFLDDAKTAMDWVISKGLIATNGAVWGGLTQECDPDPKNPPVIALQGNPLAPLWSLYTITKDTSYLTAAQQIVAWAFANFSFPDTQIFMTDEDSDWNNETLDWQWNHSGPCMFKGIFSLYLGALTVNFLQSGDGALVALGKKYVSVLQANADTLWKNYPGHIFSMDWDAPSPDYAPTANDQLNAALQYSSCSALLSAATATAVSL